MTDLLDLLLSMPPGTALWDWTVIHGNDDGQRRPSLLAKVGKGEARSSLIGKGPKVAIKERGTVIRIQNVVVVMFLFRIGNYPKPFAVVVNHHDTERPSPLETWSRSNKIDLHIYENEKKPARSISVKSDPEFWSRILGALRGVDAWPDDDFDAAAASLLKRKSPSDWWRTLKNQEGSEGGVRPRASNTSAAVYGMTGTKGGGANPAEQLVLSNHADIEIAYSNAIRNGIDDPIVLVVDMTGYEDGKLVLRTLLGDEHVESIMRGATPDGSVPREVLAIERKEMAASFSKVPPDTPSPAQPAPEGFFWVFSMAGGRERFALLSTPD